MKKESKKKDRKKNTSTKNKELSIEMIENMSLLQIIELVVEESRFSKMEDSKINKIQPALKYFADKFDITEQQALLFCICMEKGPRRIDFDDIASHLDVGKIRALSYGMDIDALIHRKLLRYRDATDEDEFDIPIPVIKALKHNKVYELPKQQGLNNAELFELMDSWFDDLSSNAVSVFDLILELIKLFEENPQLNFVQKVKELGLKGHDFLLLVFFCHRLINHDDDNIRFSDMEDIYESQSLFCNVRADLRNGNHSLMKCNLIEYRCEDGIADTNGFKLTEQAKRNLLSEFIITAHEEKLAGVILPNDLTPKTLFYQNDIQQQVEELASFLQPEQYSMIHERMKQKGFRSGFTCLFYGGPGTGKTETVYQLARQTGRGIMVVDVPQIKSKWVGDSEKNIKALFDRYRLLVETSKLAPILLFNEADAIIGKRMSGAQYAVDKMENTIQNIILQEMETLDGIMMATTNLEENLDAAFERRFLYKIKFLKPDASVRCKIWRQMIPELSENDAVTLARRFDFSGGQIENVARKNTINNILYGDDVQLLPTLCKYCEVEKLNNSERRRVGFSVIK